MLLTVWAFAQKDSNYQIKEVSFEGNEKSKRNYLLSELQVELDSVYSIDYLNQQVGILAQINGLYDASLEVDSLLKNKLVIKVKEQRTLLPVFNFGYQEGYYWLQAGMVDINLQGKGNTLYAYYQNNFGRHTGQIYYLRKPRTNRRWGYHLNLLKWSSVEPLYFFQERIFYNYDIFLFQPGLLYRLKPSIVVELSQGIFVEQYERAGDKIYSFDIPTALTLTKSLSKVRITQEKIVHNDFRLKGFRWAAQYQGVVTFESSEYFHIAEATMSYFKPINSKVYWAARLALGVSSNYDTPFAPFVIDSYRNIRGAGDRIQRGTALSTVNCEIRAIGFNLPKWQLQAVSFVDIGWIRESGEQFSGGQSHAFGGLGIRILYKPIYNAMLRVDYGRSLTDFETDHFVIGLGQYF